MKRSTFLRTLIAAPFAIKAVTVEGAAPVGLSEEVVGAHSYTEELITISKQVYSWGFTVVPSLIKDQWEAMDKEERKQWKKAVNELGTEILEQIEKERGQGFLAKYMKTITSK